MAPVMVGHYSILRSTCFCCSWAEDQPSKEIGKKLRLRWIRDGHRISSILTAISRPSSQVPSQITVYVSRCCWSNPTEPTTYQGCSCSRCNTEKNAGPYATFWPTAPHLASSKDVSRYSPLQLLQRRTAARFSSSILFSHLVLFVEITLRPKNPYLQRWRHPLLSLRPLTPHQVLRSISESLRPVLI